MSLAVILDFDGTLVDTERLHFEALNDVLKPDGLQISWETYLDDYVAYDDGMLYRMVYLDAGRPLSDDLLAGLREEKKRRFWERAEAKGVPTYAGAVALARLCMDEDIPLAMCTGSTRDDVERVMALMGETLDFAVIVTADDVEHGKPDPEGYSLTIQSLIEQYPDEEVQAEQCVAVEDTPGGLAAARTARCRTIGVTTTVGADRLVAAHLVVEDLAEIDRAELEALIGDDESE